MTFQTKNTATPTLKNKVAPSFYHLHHQIKRHEATHYWLKGGRGSTKSSFLSLEIIKGMMQDGRRNAVVFRRVASTLRESVYEQLIWAIGELGVASKWKTRVNPLTLSYGKQRIIFRGVDDPLKSKSIKLSHGYFAYIWFEELAEFPEMDTISTVLQSVMRGGSNFWCFYSYNPPESMQSWVNYEAAQPHPDKIVHHSTYLSVPEEWLGRPFIIEAEHTKSVNERKYRHQYLGEITGTGGEVFTNAHAMTMSDEMISCFDRVRAGLDWGWSIDPLAYVEFQYDAKKRTIYIYHEKYGLKIPNRIIAQHILERKLPCSVMADSAEGKSIADLRAQGVRISPCEKGKGSVFKTMRMLTDDLDYIYIDPKRCPNTYREFTSYELERDKNGNFKTEYPDKNNHTIDAVRYALETQPIRAMRSNLY